MTFYTKWELEKALEEEERASESLRAEITRLTTQVHDYEQELERHATDRVNQRAEVARLSAELAAARADAERLMHRANEKTHELNRASADVRRLTAELAARTEERDAVLASCRKVDLERYAMEKERDGLRERICAIAKLMKVPDGGGYINDWKQRAEINSGVEQERDGIAAALIPAGWFYKLIVDKHLTGPPLEGQIQVANVWGTPSDHLYFAPELPDGKYWYWKSPAYLFNESSRSAILAARDARVKAEARAEGLREAASYFRDNGYAEESKITELEDLADAREKAEKP